MSQTYFDAFLRKVEQGRKGEMVWIPSPFPRWKNIVGTTKKFYTLLGGDPGTGKSSYLDTTYILHVYEWYKEHEDQLSFKPKIILRSMERSKEYRIAKWVCHILFQKYGILMDVKTVFGMHTGESRVDDHLMEKIESCREYIENMQEIITVIDGKTNPTGAFVLFRDYALKNGTIYKLIDDQLKIGDYNQDTKKINWKDIPMGRYPDDEVMIENYEIKYIPDNDNEVVIPIVDHIGEYKSENGLTGKQLLDKAGEYTVRLRDRYHMSPIDVSQFNRNLSDTRRRTGKGIDLQPEEQDFMGSSTMYQRADLAIALFNPHRYSEKKHLGYNVQSFVNSRGYNRFRSAFVLKNSYGPDDFGAGFQFIGEIGMYRQIPKSSELGHEDVQKLACVEQLDSVTDIIKR